MARQPSKPSSLRISSWNLDGLRGRKLELVDILNRLEIDVMAIQETKLSEASRISIPDYDIYRQDRDNNGGGVALAIKKCIDHYPLQRLQTRNIEAVAIMVRSLRHGDIAVVSCYNPPRLPLLDDDLDLILSWPQTVAIGDFNAKSPAWHSRTTTTKGRVLLNYLDAHDDITILGPTEPTFYGAAGLPDVLDITLLKSIPLTAQISAEHEGSTAHNPITLDLGRRQGNLGTFTRRFTDWGRFRAEMQRSTALPVIETTQDLEAAVLSLETDIKNALTLTTTETIVPRLTNPRGILPDDIKQLIRDRRRQKRLATRTRLPRHRHDLNVLNRRVKAALSELAQERWARHLESLDPQDNSLWKVQKALRLPARRRIPPIHGSRGVVYTDQEKAEAFADSLELQCRLPQLPDEDEEFERAVRRAARRIDREPDSDIIQPATPDELRDIIRHLRNRKAPGPDLIHNTTLKRLPRKGVAALLNITNAILRLRHFPARWKTANVILIPKPNKDHTIPSNYRPISLLPAMSKVVEKIILSRLKTHSEELRVIPDEQFAFRPGHSTELQILRLTEHITAAFNRRQFTGAVFLDVAKAFDTVWHEGLLMKMLTNHYPISFTKLIKSYLHHRKFRIQVQNSYSTTRPMEAGVPQGTVLSPHLYTLYNSDIPHTPNTNTYLYADDMTITAQNTNLRQTTRLLQTSLDQLETWCNRWKVKINPDKSAALLFSRRRLPRDIDLDELTLSQEPISWERQTRYLGVTMDQRLTWKPHIVETVARARITRAKLYPLLKGGNTLSLRNKRTLIKVVLQAQLTYASTAWGHAAKSHIKSLQAVENIALRTATAAPWYVRNTDILRDLKYTNMTQTIRDRAQKRFDAAAAHDNPLLRQAVDYVPDVTDKHKRPRHLLLDPG